MRNDIHTHVNIMKTPTFTQTQHTWDIIADHFDQTRRYPWQPILDVINSLSSTAVVLDLGCGNGRHLFPCAKHCARVIGVDISKSLLSIVQKKIQDNKIHNADILQGNLVSVPVQDSSVDAILCVASLHTIHTRRFRRDALKEIYRILQPQGTLCLTVWSRWQDRFLWRFLKELFTRNEKEFGDIWIPWKQQTDSIPRYYHLYSKHELRQDINSAGFSSFSLTSLKIASTYLADNYLVVLQK